MSLSDPTDPSLPSVHIPTDDKTCYVHPLIKPLNDNAPFPFFLPTFSRLLGMSLVYSHPHLYVNSMTVTHGHTQPAGLLHGGITATLADDIAASLSHAHSHPYGSCQTQRLTADHLASAHVGEMVYGCAIPVHMGNTMHVVDVYCVGIPPTKDKKQQQQQHQTPPPKTNHDEQKHTNKSTSYLAPYRPQPSHTLSSLLSLIAKHPHFTAFHGYESSLRVLSLVRVTLAVIPYRIPSSQPHHVSQVSQQIMFDQWKDVMDQYKLTPTHNMTHIGMETAQHMRNQYPDQIQTQAPRMNDDIAKFAHMSPDFLDRFYWPKPISTTTTNSNAIPLTRCPDTASLLGIEFMSLSFSHIICRLVIRPYHLHLKHRLHGGVSLCIIEEMGSKAPALYVWPHRSLVGTHLESYFIASATEGDVLWAIAVPQHTGKTSHVWNITIIAQSQPKTDTQSHKKQPSQPKQPVDEKAAIDRLLMKQHPSSNAHPSASLDQAATLLSSSGFPMNRSHLRVISYGLLSVQFRSFPFPGDSVKIHEAMKQAARQQLKSSL